MIDKKTAQYQSEKYRSTQLYYYWYYIIYFFKVYEIWSIKREADQCYFAWFGLLGSFTFYIIWINNNNRIHILYFVNDILWKTNNDRRWSNNIRSYLLINWCPGTHGMFQHIAVKLEGADIIFCSSYLDNVLVETKLQWVYKSLIVCLSRNRFLVIIASLVISHLIPDEIVAT